MEKSTSVKHSEQEAENRTYIDSLLLWATAKSVGVASYTVDFDAIKRAKGEGENTYGFI